LHIVKKGRLQMRADRETKDEMRFEAVQRANIPTGRNGKHKAIVLALLSDIEKLASGEALKVPLAELPDSKENIRSALNRATKQLEIELGTSSDEEHLYIWRVR
jgi:TusA-related sulfurtransferase